MLAYVFAHAPAPSVDIASYEGALRRFHESLAAARPRGFATSVTYHIGSGYADWYLLEDSAALDALNEAAVSGARTAPHDAAATMAARGEGKLLSLAAGAFEPTAVHETRFSKPQGMAYPELYDLLAKSTGQPGVSLWRRMMVLGPPPEFCLVSPNATVLPPDMQPEAFTRSSI